MILDTIVENKKKRLQEQKAFLSLRQMRALAEEAPAHPASFLEGLAKKGLSIIGEFKKASPSLGEIRENMELTDRIAAYDESADCISCLTEEDHFHGSVGDFRQIRSLSALPMLRKDFMIDEYQFYEAKVIGANAILLITAILDDAQLRSFYQLAEELGLDALFEAHSEEQMDRALTAGAKIVGVNNRDLRDFTIRLDTTKRLSAMVPGDRIFVAESGIVTDADVEFLANCRADAFLIGRAFMESKNPRALALHWKEIYQKAKRDRGNGESEA